MNYTLRKSLLFFVFLTTFFFSFTFAENTDIEKTKVEKDSLQNQETNQVLEFFYGEECPHCHRQRQWFPELKKAYPDLKIESYEVWHNEENKEIWENRMKDLGEALKGVPTNIIENTVIVGFKKQEILKLLEKEYGPPATEIANEKETAFWEQFRTWSWPTMAFVLGLIDGFNPCAMWTLLILIGFLLSIESSRKRWLIGSVFIGSSGIIYMGALLAYLFGFQQIIALTATDWISWLFRGVGLLALITAFNVLRSVKTVGLDCKVQDAESKKKFRNKMQKILDKKNIVLVLLGMVGLAFTVNAFELLCSFAIPTAFTATITGSGISFGEQLTAIFIYDVAYILDDIIVFTIAMKTLSLKSISPKIVQISHLVGGIILVLLGLIMLVNPSLILTIF